MQAYKIIKGASELSFGRKETSGPLNPESELIPIGGKQHSILLNSTP